MSRWREPGEHDHRKDIIDVDDLKLLDETEKAFKITDGATSCWVPKSLATQKDDTTFSMPEWLAKKEGLI
jgi:hypothetical protein